MGNYNLGLSTSASKSSPYSLNLNYQSMFGPKQLPEPKVVELAPHEQMALFKEVERQFDAKRSMVQRIESSLNAALNLDLGNIDKTLLNKIAKSLEDTPANSLDAKSIPLGWIGLPDGYSVLIGLDHRDQPKAYGLSVKEFSVGDNLKIKLDLIYDERGAFGGN